jgi:hypothetical protein
MSEEFEQALHEFIRNVTDCIDGGPADHRDDFFAEITRHTGDKTTWGGGFGATFYDPLAKQLRAAWEAAYEAGKWDGQLQAVDRPTEYTNPYPEPEGPGVL